MIRYTDDLTSVREDMLRGFFVDLVCDEPLISCYARRGMQGVSGAASRHPAALEQPTPGS